MPLVQPEHGDGLRVLCLDGPPFATAALTEPLFLQHIAHRWAYTEVDEHAIEGGDVRVSDMFDIIGGCGIGGLYAVLLARLNMTIRQVIEFHSIMQEKLFTADCWTRKDQKGCIRTLDKVLKTLAGLGIEHDLDSAFISNGCRCYIVVLNKMKTSTSLPHALRSYQVRASLSPPCTIRQALHATLGDMEHLPAVPIGDQHFHDASDSFPNASHRMVKELAAAFPKHFLACFVNLGADCTFPENHSRIVSQDLMAQFTDLSCFFRLSVRQELHAEITNRTSFFDRFRFSGSVREPLSAEDKIKNFVLGYLQEEEISGKVDDIVDSIKGRKQIVRMLRLGNLAGEDSKTEVRKDLSHLRHEEEIRRALEKIRAPDTFRAIQEHGCLEGTREDVLKPIENWVEDVEDNTANVFWLDGYPGTGKTAICISLKQRLAELGYLGASCFFRREDASQHSLSALFRSIAFQLANNHRSIRDNIVHVTNSGAVHLESAPSVVFEKLVCGPLAAASVDLNGPIVLVLDAMDEFGESDEHRLRLVKMLLHRWIELPRGCKLFISSRSQGDLPQHLNRLSHAVRRLEVGAATSVQTRSDLRRFLEHGFEDIRKDRRTSQALVTSSELDELAVASAGLFIWAGTLLKIARQRRDHVQQILLDLRERQTTIGKTQMSELHQLYSTVLQPLLADDWPIMSFLSVVIFVRTPLSARTLSSLCDLDEDLITDTARQLGPVMDGTSELRFVHKSFVDYVLSQFSPVPLNMNSAEFMLGASCFKIMLDQLHFNMGNMASSYSLNSDFPDMHNALSNELRYASRFWGTHLAHVRKDNMMQLVEPINAFLDHRFLYWLEVVSILQCFREAMDAISKLKRPELGEEVKDFADDAFSFIRKFALPISLSYPHIYVSAMPLTPMASLIRTKYLDRLPHVLKVVSNGDKGWPAQLAVMNGHNGAVSSVAFSPDGSQIISGSNDKTIRIWDAATYQPVGEPLRGHDGGVQSIAFSPEGSQIVSGSSDKTLRIWNAATSQLVGEPLQGHDNRVMSVAFSPDGSQIASGSFDKTLRIWDVGTHQLIGEPLQGYDGSVESIAFSPDGSQIINGSDDNTIRIWDAATRQPIGEPLRGHDDYVLSVAFSPDGSQIVSGSDDSTIRIWDAGTRQPIDEPLQCHGGWVLSVTFSPDGSQIVSGSYDSTIRIWDAATRRPFGKPLKGHDGPVRSVVFSPDGSQIVSGSSDKTLRIWDAANRPPVGEPLPSHVSSIRSVAFSPDGSQIVSGSDDNTIRIWDAATRQPVGEPLQGHSSGVLSVAYSPDGSQIVSGSYDNTIRIWDAATHQPIGEPLQGHDGPVRSITSSLNRPVESVAFSPDGSQIVSACYDSIIRIWDAATHQPIGELHAHDNSVFSGPLLSGPSVLSVVFSPDGSLIVSGSSDKTLRIWDATTHQPIGEPLQGHDGSVESIAFSPDGSQIVIGSSDKTLRIWDVGTHQLVGGPLQGHDNSVKSVAFSPDGSQIVSGSYDSTIRIWDAATRRPFGKPLKGHDGPVRSVAFSPDGSQIVSGSDDNTVRIWDAATRQPVVEPIPILKPLTFLRSSQAFPSPCFLHDGWVIGSSNCRIFWIPHHLHLFLQTPGVIDIIGTRGMVVIDVADMRTGSEWISCVDTN